MTSTVKPVSGANRVGPVEAEFGAVVERVQRREDDALQQDSEGQRRQPDQQAEKNKVEAAGGSPPEGTNPAKTSGGLV